MHVAMPTCLPSAQPRQTVEWLSCPALRPQMSTTRLAFKLMHPVNQHVSSVCSFLHTDLCKKCPVLVQEGAELLQTAPKVIRKQLDQDAIRRVPGLAQTCPSPASHRVLCLAVSKPGEGVSDYLATGTILVLVQLT